MSKELDDYLVHSWGKGLENKRKEKEYNARYYREHKYKWLKPEQKSMTERVRDYQESLLDQGKSYTIERPTQHDLSYEQREAYIKDVNKRYPSNFLSDLFDKHVINTFSTTSYGGPTYTSSTTIVKPGEYRQQVKQVQKKVKEAKDFVENLGNIAIGKVMRAHIHTRSFLRNFFN